MVESRGMWGGESQRTTAAPSARYGLRARVATSVRRCLLPLAGLATFCLSLVVEPDVTRWTAQTGPVSSAHALIGRPLTPLSFAGVACRTTRRMVRRTTIYAATLPQGCATVSINGAPYYQCGATYYQAVGGQYVVVQVQ